jgi:protein involved in plasmid replication-relaxation
MWLPLHPLNGVEKMLCALATFDYLTANQITRLLYAPSSHAYVRKQLHRLVSAGFVLPLVGRLVTTPRVYTLTETGYSYMAALGMPNSKRVKPTEEQEKAHNLYFLQHTIAVTDVLISAHLLSQTVPGIRLTRLLTERELKRTIYVPLPDRTGEGSICLEPDASVQFTIHETWEDFFHIEVYRTHLREARFKRKIAGYVAYAVSPLHQQFFATSALAIAIFAATETLAGTFKRWTEEALQEVQQPELGERFFFCSLDTATASPEELFLSPVWEQALSTTKTPLLVLE